MPLVIAEAGRLGGGRLRRAKKAAETGSPATLMGWGEKKKKKKKNRARTTLRDRKGASGKRVEERRKGRRLKDRTLSTKEGRESLNRDSDSDRKDAHGRDWRCLAVPSSSCQRQG